MAIRSRLAEWCTSMSAPIKDEPAPRRICSECLSRVCHHFETPPTVRFNDSCLTIIRLVAGGLSNKEIAQYTGFTVGTVAVFLARDICRPLGLTSRLEVALYAIRNPQVLAVA